MRLLSLRSGDGHALCVDDGSGLRAVRGGHRDVGDLIRAHGGATLGEALAAEGTGAAVPPGKPCLPVRPDEVWACGVTYERSRDARLAESRDEDVYTRVYDAERPEVFFKATGPRVVGPGAVIGLRSDSAWQVPEPELALVLGADARLLGLTVGNDVSSRDIEGENPLYLPQAKVFAGSCALGPAVVPVEDLDPYSLDVSLVVERGGDVVVRDSTSTTRLHTTLDRLLDHLARDNPLPPVTVLLTGTGIVPPDGFTLEPGDVVRIDIRGIGELVNVCARAVDVPAPAGWSLRGSEVPA